MSATETAVTTLKKSDRKSRKEAGTVILDSTTTDDLPQPAASTDSPARKSKKSKRAKGSDEEDAAAVDNSEELEKKSKKKKRKHADREDQHSIALVDATDDVSGVERKKKKRKRDRDLTEPGPVEQDEKTIRKSSRKKRKNIVDTGFPNPEEDATLATDQARKALTYAYTQFSDPDTWKFNKARQNWLIRNLWSNQTIPDIHLPLVARYLSNVQGGVRKNLVATCKASLSAPPPTQDVSDQPPVSVVETTGTSDSLKSARARTVLEALELET
ncbi:hypothetical protein HWV62_36155 [Athelia sp. TMB]|nr:hypothetical protein HWV62_19981 [Athelia sp. TMB]KAF7980934.1 hypothetical protein HWV62_36155 [Athelia sp. TMB]